MTSRGGSAAKDRASNARKADTPWRKWRPARKVLKTGGGDNASRQRKALNAMSVLEMECGMTEAEHDAWHAEQRERVFARYGIDRHERS